MKRTIEFVWILLIFLCCSCMSSYSQKDYYIYAMNTTISLSFYNVDNSDELASNVEEIYMKYSNVASDFDSGYGVKSVYDLNQARTLEVSDELIEMIEFSVMMVEETNGYFNPLIGRLSQMWKDAISNGKVLENDVVLAELETMNNSSISINNNEVTINGNANIDLGGIAKGYATNEVKKYLDSQNVHSYMLNAGSSNLVLGTKDKEEFKVGFTNPLNGKYYKTLNLKNVCVATSSLEHQKIMIDGIYYSHLLNPKTGYPSRYYDSLSIFGDDSGLLDVYSTACYAMEYSEMCGFLQGKGLHFIAVKDDEIYESEGFIYE